MSGFTSQQSDNKTIIEECEDNLLHRNKESFSEIVRIWQCIYGHNDKHLQERTAKIEHDLKTFWEYQIEAQEERKRELMKSIEQMGRDAVRLEKALNLEPGINGETADVPLVELEEQVWKLLDSYRHLQEQRLQEYSEIQKREKELCSLLGEQPQFRAYVMHSDDAHLASTPSTMSPHQVEIPSREELAQCEERVNELERLKHELEFEFESYKRELKYLMMDCQIHPLTKLERFVYSNEEEFTVNKENLELLKSATNKFRKTKEELILEADQLRQEISDLYKKMLKDSHELQEFLNQHCGFTKTVIDKLKEKLKALKEERKHTLKDLILNHRTVLDELWTRCCYSDEQRAKFTQYHVKYYSEEVLNFHELEVEKLEHFYYEHRRIFQLAEKHSDLWKRLLELEQLATQTDRLFSNRGGRLLQEEKERKLIQKKVPAIKAELITLLNKYKAETGKDFLYFGEPLQATIERMEEQREITKENQKMQRKAANTDNLLIESRLGARPLVGCKRKMLTPQQPNRLNKVVKPNTHSTTNSTTSTASSKSGCSAASAKVVREEDFRNVTQTRVHMAAAPSGCAAVRTPVKTPAASTPENGSPSYESFQEHIEKSNQKDIRQNSTKTSEQRVLRPRNLNETKTISSAVKTYKTPKTPVRTPSKIPFRIATGSKIPSIVPPISPRSASKLTTPRSRLPIIF